MCTRLGTASATWLAETVPCACRLVDSVDNDDMYEKYFAGQCNALVYDFPLSAQQLLERGATDPSIATQHSLVGPVLNDDPYGFAIAKYHPLYEPLKKSMIVVNQEQPTEKIQLRQQWFSSDAKLDDHWIMVGNTGYLISSKSAWLPPLAFLVSVSLSVFYYALRRSSINANLRKLKEHQGSDLEGTPDIVHLPLANTSEIIQELAENQQVYRNKMSQYIAGSAALLVGMEDVCQSARERFSSGNNGASAGTASKPMGSSL